MSKKDTHRVQFVADSGLVDRTDAVADIQGLSRTELIRRALHSYLAERSEDEQFRRRAQEALIDGRIDEETFRRALGTEELVRARQLEAAFETLGEGVPDPDEAPAIPSDEAFYGTDGTEQVIDIDADSQLVVRPAPDEDNATQASEPE